MSCRLPGSESHFYGNFRIAGDSPRYTNSSGLRLDWSMSDSKILLKTNLSHSRAFTRKQLVPALSQNVLVLWSTVPARSGRVYAADGTGTLRKRSSKSTRPACRIKSVTHKIQSLPMAFQHELQRGLAGTWPARNSTRVGGMRGQHTNEPPPPTRGRGSSATGVIGKQGVHGISNAVSQVVADCAYAFQPCDQSAAFSCR